MKVLVFNVKYSENLGDGILARCLEDELSHCGAEVETIDLAGRQGFGEPRGNRRLALGVLGHMPAAARRAAVKAALGRSLPGLAAQWRRRMAGAQAVVIGGGNLFQDDDLNFPLKVAAVLDCARAAALPVAIHAVGVGGRWSRQASALFGRIGNNRVVHVSLRDAGARDNWLRHFGDRYAVELSPDPGLLACDLAPAGLRRPAAGVVAVCVTHPVVLARHSSLPRAQIPLLSPAGYGALALALADRGCRVLLFTNGAREDQQFLEAIMRRMPCAALAQRGTLTAAARPTRPEELVAVIAGAEAVLAHRLHACIVAYSLGRPHIGLGWDAKVEHFFGGVGRSRYFLHGAAASAGRLADLTIDAIDEGIDAGEHARQLAGARHAVARLAGRLRAAVA